MNKGVRDRGAIGESRQLLQGGTTAPETQIMSRIVNDVFRPLVRILAGIGLGHLAT